MALVPAGYLTVGQIADKIESAKLKLGPEVVQLRYSIEPDTTGDPAVYFRITLRDIPSNQPAFAQTTRQIASTLREELKPYDDWGLIPYFAFRNASEQARMQDPMWA